MGRSRIYPPFLQDQIYGFRLFARSKDWMAFPSATMAGISAFIVGVGPHGRFQRAAAALILITFVVALVVTADFDEIALLTDSGRRDRYDALLLSLIPDHAVRVLDIGCGLGGLTLAMARENREVVGIDLSHRMIDRAREANQTQRVSFHQGNFLEFEFDSRRFDCIISAAALHHMPYDAALLRMVDLLAPGGRLIIHDLRRNVNLVESLQAYTVLAEEAFRRMILTGRLRPPRKTRQAWARHQAYDEYLSLREANELADRFLPGASVINHWLWRFTIVWNKQVTA